MEIQSKVSRTTVVVLGEDSKHVVARMGDIFPDTERCEVDSGNAVGARECRLPERTREKREREEAEGGEGKASSNKEGRL